MKTALPNPSGPVFELNPDLMAKGIEASRESPRRRMILPIHREQDALVQRMLNFFQPGTYVQPHIHPRESASETIYMIQGKLGFLTFTEAGAIEQSCELKAGGLIDIEPDICHGMICLAPDTVILEVKRGPYDAAGDKTFAEWAPSENSAEEASRFLAKLEARFQRKIQQETNS